MNTIRRRGAFISYSRKDKEFALELARELRSGGCLVWLDQLDIPTGARWDDEVEKALHEYEIFLIILTPASVSSENVKDEIGYVIDHSKRIMPVLLEECVIPLRLRRFQYVDFTKMEFSEGIRRAKQLLEALLNEPSTPVVTINPVLEPQKAPNREATPRPPLPNKNKSVQRRWVGVGAGILALATCLGVIFAIIIFKDLIFPPTPTQVPTAQVPTAGETIIQTSTELPTNAPAPAPATEPPSISSPITWTIDTAGVCRDDKGDYPRWSEYSWTLLQCEEACQNNPNCQGFAMSKQKNYCQLLGSDGNNEGSNPNAQITRGDQAQPDYSCYLKSDDQSILAWTMDSRGVCRDSAGGYPRWSEYSWTFSQCEDACQNNPNCQAFAMSKEKDYCQLFGSDGQYDGSSSGVQITQGDSSQPEYACFIKR